MAKSTQETRRVFNYPGAKIKFVPQINALVRKIPQDQLKTFVEPFAGTASILLNLPDGIFSRLVANDLNPDIIRILKSFRDGSYQQLVDMYASIEAEFGSIQHDKEAYYNFRNTYNSRYYKTNSVEKGFFLYIASRAAINSLFRTGPAGFNQSFGNRGGKLNMKEGEFNKIQSIFKNTVFYTGDYIHIMDVYDNPDTLFFIDPPYVERKVQGSYKDENEFDQELLIQTMKGTQGKIIYTDVYNEELLAQLGPNWQVHVLSDKKNVSPGRNQGVKIDYVEVAYYNF